MASALTALDLTRPLAQVARDLPQWDRGDVDEAVAATLDLSARNGHARAYVAWVWTVAGADGAVTWLLPVTVGDAERFSPRGPMAILTRCMRAAVLAGADPARLALFDWEGFVGLAAPGVDPELTAIALAETHPEPGTAQIAPAPIRADGPPLDLAQLRAHTGADGIIALAAEIRSHPLAVAPALIEQGWTLEEAEYPEVVADLLGHSGFLGPEIPADEPSLAIEDDPCTRRRYARRLLRRLLHKGKIGGQYHTAFDHIAHGVAPEDRADAYAIGEALIREGLLGEKPSAGQRHVFLRRDGLPAIHALIERAESSAHLAAEWSCGPPGG